ncbi:Galacturonokinase [Sesamum angolense]|uniref:Galacturonokinase n=1 Tax=Sesamum angolense TaxID=2727404 RepID=A0AAE1WNG6_9LAMI|nr:Galacturonokinase [Sesamum angolense]
MSGKDPKEVRVVISPYRICPLGAHIDHQQHSDTGGFCINITECVKWVFLYAEQPRNSAELKNSGALKRSSSSQEECNWGNYARGALYALQKRGNHLKKGIIGFICGTEGLDSSGLSSSAAVGVAYLLAFESANKLIISPTENIEYDRASEAEKQVVVGKQFFTLTGRRNYITQGKRESRLIENEYLGLKNGILDQSAILLSSYGCLTCMNCKTKEHRLIRSPESNANHNNETKKQFNILLAFSGLKQALITNPGYNSRVAECQEAAKILLQASGNEGLEPILSNVDPKAYEEHKGKLDPSLARRAEHYFSENKRVKGSDSCIYRNILDCYFFLSLYLPFYSRIAVVLLIPVLIQGLEAWASGNIEDFGKLISASGLSSIKNYESGCEPLVQLHEILLRAPGVYGARFSGAGFRGCCIAFVDADRALDAASFIREEYPKLQPELASQIDQEGMVLICDAGDCARVI